MAAMMRQSHTNVHPARESKGMADKTKTDEAQWLGSRSSTLVGTCSPSGWMRRTLSLPSCHAARRAKINANAQDGNKLRLTSRPTRQCHFNRGSQATLAEGDQARVTVSN